MLAELQFSHARKLAPAVYVGCQDGCGVVESFKLYNLTADIPGHPVGSTVSEQTLVAAGYIVPPGGAAAPRLREAEVVRHPAGGWTHAVPVGAGTVRVYRGNWPTRAAALVGLFFGGGRKTPHCA
jgi:hypothetical protein